MAPVPVPAVPFSARGPDTQKVSTVKSLQFPRISARGNAVPSQEGAIARVAPKNVLERISSLELVYKAASASERGRQGRAHSRLGKPAPSPRLAPNASPRRMPATSSHLAEHSGHSKGQRGKPRDLRSPSVPPEALEEPDPEATPAQSDLGASGLASCGPPSKGGASATDDGGGPDEISPLKRRFSSFKKAMQAKAALAEEVGLAAEFKRSKEDEAMRHRDRHQSASVGNGHAPRSPSGQRSPMGSWPARSQSKEEIEAAAARGAVNSARRRLNSPTRSQSLKGMSRSPRHSPRAVGQSEVTSEAAHPGEESLPQLTPHVPFLPPPPERGRRQQHLRGRASPQSGDGQPAPAPATSAEAATAPDAADAAAGPQPLAAPHTDPSSEFDICGDPVEMTQRLDDVRAEPGKLAAPAGPDREPSRSSVRFGDILHSHHQELLLGDCTLARAPSAGGQSVTRQRSTRRRASGMRRQPSSGPAVGKSPSRRPSRFARGAERRRSGSEADAEKQGGASARDKLHRMRTHEVKASESLWIGLFENLQHDGQVHRDDLITALEFSGMAAPNQKSIDEVYNRITSYSAIGQEDFARFMSMYILHQNEVFTEAFERVLEADAEEPEVHVTKLPDLVKALGLLPMKHVLDDVVREVTGERKERSRERESFLGLQDFLKVAKLLLLREGFTKQEHDQLLRMHSRFDRDCSGDMASKELHEVLSRLGYALDERRVEHLMSSVDVDKNGTLDKREFLMCMRKVREREVKIIEDLIKMGDADNSGAISIQELEGILKLLGYTPMPGAVEEATRDAGVPSGSEVSMDQVWQVLAIYRSRGGLGAEEAKEVHSAFDKLDADNDGELLPEQVLSLVQWLGYRVSYHLVQHAFKEVDLDRNDKLDFNEFIKILRVLRERDVARARRAFAKCSGLGANELHGITQKQAAMALLELGGSDVDDAVCRQAAASVMITPGSGDPREKPFFKGAKDPYIDLDGFLRAALRLLRATRLESRERHGFGRGEALELRQLFASYSHTSMGRLETSELTSLVEDNFADIVEDPKVGPELKDAIMTAGSGSRGELSYNEFLMLMRRAREFQDRHRLEREHAAVSACAFEQKEVEIFRDMFMANDRDDSGEVSQRKIYQMLQSIEAAANKFPKLLANARTTLVQGHQGFNRRFNSDGLDFPEFLCLMKGVFDITCVGEGGQVDEASKQKVLQELYGLGS